ncbi:hypothetical protein GCM10010145_48240 [Streptomyces ruber]|uniref:Uncharacterized protein n=1 Tax=Streptomyces ruber TaxID=83378 RepID=A0A918BJ48_9ACTN|nr:hypothetical protein GCM10010145_48240 [Streptomyces ruber]
MPAGERDGLVPVTRLGDHLDVRVPGQDGPHTRPDHRLVVGHQDPDRSAARCRLFHAASLRAARRRANGEPSRIRPGSGHTPDEGQDAAAVRPMGAGTADF